MRRYDEPVEVRLADHRPAGEQQADEPGQFLWRGRLYVVRAVLASWVEVGAWWRARDAAGLPRPVNASGRAVWRVEAGAGRSTHEGVYDLIHELGVHELGIHELASPAPWRLARAFD